MAAFVPYCGAGPVPAELWSRWNLDPWLLAALAGAVLAYAATARGRGVGERACFAAAAAVFVVAFVSPLCALSSALFWARVTHHLLLTTLAAPLLAWSLKGDWLPRRAPLLGLTAAHAALFWFWHAPSPYAWALSSDAGYWLMQITLTGSAVAFWSGVRRAPAMAAVGCLLLTMVQMGLLGALITFAGQALYAPHFATTLAWGMTPLEDQQLAGLIMWAPGAAAYLLSALGLLGAWLGQESARTAPAR